MRKLIVSNLISMDGFISGPGGDLMAMPFDETFSQHNLELLREADTLLLGRNTYTDFAGYWPPIADDESQPDVEREISRLNGAARKVVVSDTLTAGLGAWADSTEVVRSADLGARIRSLKEERGGTIVTFGSGVLVRSLLQLGLVDELHLQVGANAVGTGGLPLFDAPIPGRITLADVRVPEGSQNAILTYVINQLVP
ncbi:MAG: dihydrofolate reductase family protein [Actinomycetota bacterium]